MNAATGQKGSLLHVTDKLEGHKWLVDGGALLSIIPPTPSQRRHGSNGLGLCAANGTKIDCYGSVQKTIVIGERSFTFLFTIANVRQRILGADFLAEFYLAPNHRDGSLIDLNTLDVIPATNALRPPTRNGRLHSWLPKNHVLAHANALPRFLAADGESAETTGVSTL